MMRRLLSVLLVLCILVIGGVASAQSISHESQHSHHQKATHSSILCSWMCAAGQTHDASFLTFEHKLVLLASVEQINFVSHLEIARTLRTTRAPPQPSA